MTIPLAKKIDGKKFMWDGEVYDSQEMAQFAMDEYAADGFEVKLVDEAEQILVYTRRVAAVQSGS